TPPERSPAPTPPAPISRATFVNRSGEALEAEARFGAGAPGGRAARPARADDDLGLLGEGTRDYLGAGAVADAKGECDGPPLPALAQDPHAAGLSAPASRRSIRSASAARPAVLTRPPLGGGAALAGTAGSPLRVGGCLRGVCLHARGTKAQGGVQDLEHAIPVISDDLDVGGHAGEELEVGVVGGHHHVI